MCVMQCCARLHSTSRQLGEAWAGWRLAFNNGTHTPAYTNRSNGLPVTHMCAS